MRALVFTDESLRRHAGRFVWLSIDGEKAKNAALRRRLRLTAFPTFFVIDPADERVVFRWVGGFGADQFPHLLDAGETAVRGGRSPFDRRMVRADSLFAAGQDSAAAAAYEQLLADAPAGFVHRGRALESMVFALEQSGQFEAAAQRAVDEVRDLGRTPSAASVAATGLDAALQLPPDHERRGALVPLLESATADLLADTTLGITPDDRSGLYITLIGARADAGDSLSERRLTEAWAAFLERSAERARTPSERTVYDSHRLSAYLELHQPERALPMLEQSERDFPDDYNPPARLSVALRELGRWDEALAASDRALARAYGPRLLVVYRARVAILTGRGDRAGARDVLEKAIATLEALPEGQRPMSGIRAFRKQLEELAR